MRRNTTLKGTKPRSFLPTYLPPRYMKMSDFPSKPNILDIDTLPPATQWIIHTYRVVPVLDGINQQTNKIVSEIEGIDRKRRRVKNEQYLQIVIKKLDGLSGNLKTQTNLSWASDYKFFLLKDAIVFSMEQEDFDLFDKCLDLLMTIRMERTSPQVKTEFFQLVVQIYKFLQSIHDPDIAYHTLRLIDKVLPHMNEPKDALSIKKQVLRYMIRDAIQTQSEGDQQTYSNIMDNIRAVAKDLQLSQQQLDRKFQQQSKII